MRFILISIGFVLFTSACTSTDEQNIRNSITIQKPIPRACLGVSANTNSENNYQFVTGLFGSANGGYNDKRKFYSPIQTKTGYIKYDVNQDGLQDFIFLERTPNKNNTRLMTCISNATTQQYKRLMTPYLIREYKTPSLYIETTSISFKNNILSINFSTHAHNDGGESETSEYEFNQQSDDFVLTKFEYSSYGEVFPEISQTFDFKKQSYQEETGCSFANNPSAMGYNPNCKPRKLKGCLPMRKSQTIRTRINKDKIIKKTNAC